jgi:hypothetical protein
VAALVLAYYVLLRSILKAQSALRACLSRCRHCRIFFLTHPRNARRCDLRCPFGCREAHRQAQSNRRSTAYYRDEAGKAKKRQQNAQRRRPTAPAAPAVEPPEAPLPWPRSIVEHVRLVTGLIEGRQVSRAETLEMLARAVRQHSMVRQRRKDQVVVWLHGQPP